MKVIVGFFLVIFGIGFVIAAGAISNFPIESETINLLGMEVKTNLLNSLAFVAVGGITGLIGLILVITGVLQIRRDTVKEKELLTSGITTRARVTFVDKNYSFLVNEKPIYSIIEYTFVDRMGRKQIGRETTADSDLVIRNQIVVGSEVEIRYNPENPQENMVILNDPSDDD